ncbi:MAG TPA: CoB--CoM heterodisulfide reductase iron-sulfur subunit B family protein [Spirochaetia bacterium]|nr:CoB--CoM heterodisulfide reductase iron-sulfur subunit B family protein [Spirochaetia bacterium]
MRYFLYPGCSMEADARFYLTSLEAVAGALDIELQELPDWNCCGATVASSVIGDAPAQVMALRNLGLAETSGGLDVVVGCSSCYMNLSQANRRFQKDPHFRALASESLAAGGMKYEGTVNVRFILEMLVNDVGYERIAARVKRPLKGLKVAGYVGCESVRVHPWEFDDPEQPVALDKLVEALGATPVPFPLKARCCGSSHNLPQTEIVTSCSRDILESAAAGEAQLMVTPCPMCQMNMDVYQSDVNKAHGTSFNIPVLFFTQLMAIAFDLAPSTYGLKANVVAPGPVLSKFGVTA